MSTRNSRVLFSQIDFFHFLSPFLSHSLLPSISVCACTCMYARSLSHWRMAKSVFVSKYFGPYPKTKDMTVDILSTLSDY